MARKKSSCLKRIAFGCGTLVLGFVLLGFGLFISASLNKPKPPERKAINVAESFSGNQENALNLPDPSSKGKPITLKLDVSMLEFRLEPNEESKEILVEGDYDKANFELETKMTEKDDEIVYEVTFKNKRTLLGMLLQGGIDDDDIDNRVVVKVPRDLLFDIQFEMDMGEADLDLSGLAVANFKGDFSMGEIDLVMEEPNQVKMTNFNLESGMGETTISDFQNYRMTQGNLRSSMGEVRIRNSGDLLEPANVNLKMTMGEMRFEAPPNAKIESKNSVMMGENQQPGESRVEADGPELKIKSSVTMGSMRLSRRYSRNQITGRMLRTIREEGVDAAVAEYHEFRKTKSQFFDFRPSSLNRLGYRLMRTEKYDDAIAIFKLNVETHPTYANGFDSLAEAYMKAGKRELAIKNYEKAVELDPNNDNAYEMLAILKNEIPAKDGDQELPKAPESPQPPDQ